MKQSTVVTFNASVARQPPSTFCFLALTKLDSVLVFNPRTREALHARKLNGVKFGRPHGKGKSRFDKHTADIQRLIALKVLRLL